MKSHAPSADRLEELAAAVADHMAVDWTSVERNAADEDSRAAIRELETLARIAEVHRAVDGASPATWGGLVLRERIGSGAEGVVYRAWDPKLEREVALKLLSDDGSAAEALEEGRRLARVRHPGVVAVYGTDRVDGRGGIWMELVEGPTLAELVREQGARDARDAAAIGAALCRALHAVHEVGLVHRDVKASNVVREVGGRVVLMDLGVAVEPDRPAVEDQRGTPLYMAPELLRGEAPSVHSDLYALGVLLFYLVTGEHPLRGHTLADLLEAHAAPARAREWGRGVPTAFARIVERALAADARERWTSAAEMEQALSAWLESERSRRRLGRGLVLALTCLTVCAGILVTRPWERVGRGPAAASPTAMPDDPLVALEQSAGLHAATGAYDEARALYERAVELRERRAGPSHESVADALTRLAGVLAASGQTDAARRAYERAVAILTARLGGSHPRALMVARGLASLGRPPRASSFPDAPRAHRRPAAEVGDPFVRPLGATATPSALADQIGDASKGEIYAISAALVTLGDRSGARAQSWLEVSTSVAVFLYVLEEAPSGPVAVTFPPAGLAGDRPLPERVTHRLPLAARPEGTRRLVLASPAPLLEIEEALRTARVLQSEAEKHGIPLPAATEAALRALDAGGTRDVALFPQARALAGHLEMVSGLWIRVIGAGASARSAARR